MESLIVLCITIVIIIFLYNRKKIDESIGLCLYNKIQKNIKDINKHISFDDFYEILRKEFWFFRPKISKKSNYEYKIIKIKFIFHYISIKYNITKKNVESISILTKKTHKILKNNLT